MTQIICSGFGGQGVLVAGLILADAGMEAGKYVTWYPSYGAEMRGGTANCNVKIDDEEIASPYCDAVDILYTLNETAIEKFESKLRPGGLLLVNSSLTKEDRKYREDIVVVKVPASEIAKELGNSHGINITMLGALACASPDYDEDEMREAMVHYFAKKGKKNDKNIACFDRGAQCAKEYLNPNT